MYIHIHIPPRPVIKTHKSTKTHRLLFLPLFTHRPRATSPPGPIPHYHRAARPAARPAHTTRPKSGRARATKSARPSTNPNAISLASSDNRHRRAGLRAGEVKSSTRAAQK
jgi:hypothetical protein